MEYLKGQASNAQTAAIEYLQNTEDKERLGAAQGGWSMASAAMRSFAAGQM